MFLGTMSQMLFLHLQNQTAVTDWFLVSETSTLCPSDASQIDGFFSKTNYIGNAFCPGSDEDNNWAAG